MLDGRASRDRLVQTLAAAGHIRSPRVAAAFGAVPRELFLPHLDPSCVYQDEAVVTRRDQDGRPLSSSSQPSIMAIMLEQLGVEPGHHVLEIGAGTGYNAALLGHLVGPHGHVVSLDIDQDAIRAAREHLGSADFANVDVVAIDGAGGWPPAAPYDRIISTASTRDIPPGWVQQLAEDGRMVLPLSLRGVQRSVALQRAEAHLFSTSVVGCGFMPLRGSSAGPGASWPLGSPGAYVAVESARETDAASLRGALARPGTPIAASVGGVDDAEIKDGLALWIMLHEPDAALLTAVGPATETSLLPASLALLDMTVAVVLLGDRGLAALVRPETTSTTSTTGTTTVDATAVAIQPFGPNAEDLASRLLGHVRSWADNGRKSSADLTVRAYPCNERDSVESGRDTEVHLPHTRLVFDFHHPAE